MVPLSVETVILYGIPMSFLYITHAVIKKKKGTIWFSIAEPFVSYLLWWLHYESLPGYNYSEYNLAEEIGFLDL